MKEEYYAIRIGRGATAYFMVHACSGAHQLTPRLFINHYNAQECIDIERPEQPAIVKVSVTTQRVALNPKRVAAKPRRRKPKYAAARAAIDKSRA